MQMAISSDIAGHRVLDGHIVLLRQFLIFAQLLAESLMLLELALVFFSYAVEFRLYLIGDIGPFGAGLGQKPSGRLGVLPPLRLAWFLRRAPLGCGLFRHALFSLGFGLLGRLLRLGKLARLVPWLGRLLFGLSLVIFDLALGVFRLRRFLGLFLGLGSLLSLIERLSYSIAGGKRLGLLLRCLCLG